MFLVQAACGVSVGVRAVRQTSEVGPVMSTPTSSPYVTGETEASTILQGFGDDVDHLIDEPRGLAHGIYPALLTSYGLATAMVSAGVRSGRPVTVQASGVRRCRPDVEVAVYFSCLAALDNAAKHPDRRRSRLTSATPVTRWTSRSATPARGFDLGETQVGTGIANMRDRIAAVGDSAAASG